MNKPALIARLTGPARPLPARIRHGRPRTLTGHVLTASALAEITLHAAAGPAPQAGALTGIATWLALTIRGDLAPPPGQ